jgi:hypothetical protein
VAEGCVKAANTRHLHESGMTELGAPLLIVYASQTGNAQVRSCGLPVVPMAAQAV